MFADEEEKMMKVILVNGSPNEYGCTYTALSEAAKTLNEAGIGTEFFWIGKKPISNPKALQISSCFPTNGVMNPFVFGCSI